MPEIFHFFKGFIIVVDGDDDVDDDAIVDVVGKTLEKVRANCIFLKVLGSYPVGEAG